MLSREVVFPVLVIIFSAVILSLIPQFSMPMYQQDASVGAKFFPTVIAVAQILICIGLIVQYKLKKPQSSEARPIFTPMSLFGLGFLLFYAVFMSIAGYLIASLVTFTLYLVCLKMNKPMYYIVAWLFVFGIYYLFGTVFLISLPTGIFY